MRYAVLLISFVGGCATATDLGVTNGKDAGHAETATSDTGTPQDDGVPTDSGAGEDVVSTDTDVTTDSGTDSATTMDSAEMDSGSVDAGVTTVTFPSSTSSTYTTYDGSVKPLGTGGGGVHYETGDYCEESFARSAPVTKLDLAFDMSDLTSGCAVGMSHTFDVKLNGTTVGSYSFTTGATSAGMRSISQSYTFAAVSPSAGMITIRLEATSTVCSGGSSWNWMPGGTATMQ